MNNTISVIIPAYNVGDYIGKCLDSVFSGTYGDLEVIVVNDGSTDCTAEVINRYAGDPRLKYILQKNSGVSAARNAGIDAAAGDFLTFADSDDWIEPDMYEKLYSAIIREKADMAVCNFNLVYDDRTALQYGRSFSGAADIYPDVYAYFCIYCASLKPNNYLWTRLYRSDIVKRSGIRFEQYKLGDDTLFNFKLLPHLRRAAWIPDGLYNYRQRIDSNIYTAAHQCELASVYADTFDALADYYAERGFTEFLQVLPVHALSRLRSVFFYSRLAGIGESQIADGVTSGFQGRKIADYLTGKLP